ncbi:MAG: hypothetical protein CSA07_01035 [Bacteroidia bacterium]|nr:MAG: hypothetical protein CSA07_01035 [Bacteroidia bacterium]
MGRGYSCANSGYPEEVLTENEPAATLTLWSAYLPPVDYLWRLAQHGRVAVEVGETYAKQSYRNRCEIVGAQGRQALSIPVKRPGDNHTPTCGVLVDYSTPWQRAHLGAIRAAYGKAAYYIHYCEELESIILSGEERLYRLNARLLDFLLRSFGVGTELLYLEDYQAERKGDARELYHPKRAREGQGEYYQVFGERHGFVANASGLDLLMNEGPGGLAALTPPSGSCTH